MKLEHPYFMGRRVAKSDQRFVYDGYLQIADSRGNTYVWDPTEPVATRPLAWRTGTNTCYYTHDANKNVSKVVAADGTIAAHYEYAPFGAVTAQRGESAAATPWRFSGEYADDETGTVYYNYRHYDPAAGRWMVRDRLFDFDCYRFVSNHLDSFDYLGDESKNDPSWKKRPALKDIKEVVESEPQPSAYLKSVVSGANPSRADVFGRLDPPPPHTFEARSVCAYGNHYKVVLTFKLTLRIWYVPIAVQVTLPDGTKTYRTEAGVARTISHEKEHAKHFSAAFDEVWGKATKLRGDGDGIGLKEWADEKVKEIKESIKSGEIYLEWKHRVDEEDAHSGEDWDAWYKNNGPAIP